MPDITPSSFVTLLPVLGAAFLAGGVTQLARQLAQATPPRVRTTLALAVAAGIAALTVSALLKVSLPSQATPELLLAAACITGWSGPGILARLGTLIEHRLGLNATAPATPEEQRELP